MTAFQKKPIFLVIFLIFSISTLYAKNLTVVYPFSPDDLTTQSSLLFDELKKIEIEGVAIDSVQKAGTFNSLLELNDDSARTTIKKFAQKRKADFVLFTELSHAVGQINIEYKLYSLDNNSFIATLFDWAWYNQVHLSAKTFEKQLSRILQSKIIKIGNIVALGDSSLHQITVTFETYGDSSTYTILRSLLKEGPYDTIATTSTTTYTDTDVQPGTVYWYKVQALKDGFVADTSTATSAYIPPENKENLDLDKVLAVYKKPEEKPADEEQKTLMKTHIELIKPYYMNAVKLRIIMQIVKSYIAKGQLTVLKDFDTILMDSENNTIYFIKKNTYVVKLETKKPFELLAASNYDIELLQKLLLNAIAFGAQDGFIEITDDEGYTAWLPLYQSIGIATTYFKEYKNWAGNSILWSTSNKEIKEKMKEYSNQ
ncbi:MAG: hypothetical protein N3F66_08755 [Spirochaetes bacterium]|nr:hypothetical protein [Spirochaetota bacterium]